MNDLLIGYLGSAAIITIFIAGISLSVSKRKANREWNEAWAAANNTERRKLIDTIPSSGGMEGALLTMELHDRLDNEEKQEQRDKDCARLNVADHDLDRALLAEQAQQRNIRVRNTDTDSDLQEKINLFDARMKTARIEADLPPILAKHP